MMELYKLIPYEQMKDGDPVLAFGVHVLRWDFEQMGQPKYAFVPVDFDIDGLRARIAELEAAIKAAADAQEKWRQLWTAGLVDEAPEA